MTNAELFKQMFGRYATEVWSLPENEFLEWLNADVQPKTGRWLEKEVVSDKEVIEEWQSARCSVCDKYHTTPYMYYFSEYNYCPNCGARMEEEK